MTQLSLPISAPPRKVGRNSTTFTDNMSLPVHRWFRYSAGFSAEWVARVIESSDAQHVLDPYGGSGTTVLAAEQCGVDSIGTDIHPFVTRVARAKLQWRLDPDELVRRGDQVRLVAERRTDWQPPDSPLIAKCFPDAEALADLTFLRDAVEALRQGDGYDEMLWLAIVSIIRACSPAGTAQWQYVLPNKTKSRVAEPYSAFEQRVALFADDMRSMTEYSESPQGKILETDARTLEGVEDNWADLVVTSPPYANNYDYADATRLEQTFLGEISGWGELRPLRKKLLKSATQNVSGWDPAEALDSPLLEPVIQELQPVFDELQKVKATKGGKKAYDVMIAGYFFDSAQNLHALRRVCAAGAKVCYVVGDSAPYGVHVPVEKWLGELALAAGFRSWTFEKVRDRNTKWKNRKHRHPLQEGRLWIEG